MIATIVGLVLLISTYGLTLCMAGGKKQPKPGRDYDERGPY